MYIFWILCERERDSANASASAFFRGLFYDIIFSCCWATAAVEHSSMEFLLWKVNDIVEEKCVSKYAEKVSLCDLWSVVLNKFLWQWFFFISMSTLGREIYEIFFQIFTCVDTCVVSFDAIVFIWLSLSGFYVDTIWSQAMKLSS